jgi:pimeloyl-ACP methyl ester carboxylesterase
MTSIVYIPGILGSNLFIDGGERRPIWRLPNISANDLRLPDPPGRVIVADGVNLCYEPMRHGLQAVFDVRLFAYDWRRGVAENAERLQQFVVEQRLDRFHIVAHSMGGMIARLWLGAHGESFHGKLLMLGTPNHGSWIAPALLGLQTQRLSLAASFDTLSALLAEFHIPLSDDLLAAAHTWPGAWDLLPHQHTGRAAEELHTNVPAEVRLRHAALDGAQFDPHRMHYIGGQLPTLDLDANPLFGSLAPLFSAGDSVVPIRIGLVHENDPVERMIVDHVRMTMDPIVITRVISLLS